MQQKGMVVRSVGSNPEDVFITNFRRSLQGSCLKPQIADSRLLSYYYRRLWENGVVHKWGRTDLTGF